MEDEIAFRKFATNNFRIQLHRGVHIKEKRKFDNWEALKIYLEEAVKIYWETCVEEMSKVLRSKKQFENNDTQSIILMNELSDHIGEFQRFLHDQDMVEERLSECSEELNRRFNYIRKELDSMSRKLETRMKDLQKRIVFYRRLRMAAFVLLFILFALSTGINYVVAMVKPRAFWPVYIQAIIIVFIFGVWNITYKYIKNRFLKDLEVNKDATHYMKRGAFLLKEEMEYHLLPFIEMKQTN